MDLALRPIPPYSFLVATISTEQASKRCKWRKDMGIFVTLRTLTVFLWGFLMAAAAVAGEEHKVKIEVAVSDDGQEDTTFEWHGDGSEIEDLEVGESKTITDDDGNEVTITRTGDGLEIEVDGKNIELMHMASDINVDVLHDKGAHVVIHGEHDSEDVTKEKHKRVKIIKSQGSDGITIISGDEIDEETRARLEEVLKNAGKDGTVLFIDGSELSGDEQAQRRREVRVIRKEVDVTN